MTFFFDDTFKSDTRYDLAKLVNYDDTNGFDILDSYFIGKLLKLESTRTYTVTGKEIRPELISYEVYGHTQYWWILMIYNDIWDELELVSGTVLNIPSLPDMEDLYFSLKAKSNE